MNEFFSNNESIVSSNRILYIASEVFYSPGDAGIMYNDPEIGIEWPFELIGGKENLIIRDKDLQLMSIRDYIARIESEKI